MASATNSSNYTLTAVIFTIRTHICTIQGSPDGFGGLVNYVMQSWYRVDLPPSECGRNGKADQLQKAFGVMYITRRRPKDTALFEWHDEILQGSTFFFSPAAAALIKTLLDEVGGVPCGPPMSDRLLLLIGRPGARESMARWSDEGQDVAEYAIMLAVILVIVMGVVRLIGSNASTIFSQVASGIQ